MLKKVLTFTLVSLIATSLCARSLASEVNLTSEETRQTIELIRTCDLALNSCQQEVQSQKELISRQDESLAACNKEVAKGRKDNVSTGTVILIAIAAALVGAAVGGGVSK